MSNDVREALATLQPSSVNATLSYLLHRGLESLGLTTSDASVCRNELLDAAAALSQPEAGEPAAWLLEWPDGGRRFVELVWSVAKIANAQGANMTPLYTAPPASADMREAVEKAFEDILSRVAVFRDHEPEEDETWESWYFAAFDLLWAEIKKMQRESLANARGTTSEGGDPPSFIAYEVKMPKYEFQKPDNRTGGVTYRDGLVDDPSSASGKSIRQAAVSPSDPTPPDREAVARIIEPCIWDLIDAARGKGHHKWADDLGASSLTKADAILSLTSGRR